jgi:integrase
LVAASRWLEYQSTRGQYVTALSGDLVAKMFLFLGFSFTDPNLDYILSRVRISLHGKAPLLSADIRRIVAARRDDLIGVRDSALVLVGFAGGFRRSELAGIHICDLKFSADGVVVTVRKSKTDQEGAGREVGLPFGASPETCPVRALRQWLDRARIQEGPVFRSVGRYGHVSRRGLHKDSIGKLLKRAAARAGMNIDPLGGHSLRAGCVTQAAMNGVREFVIMRQTGHKAVATLRRYIRSGEIFRENAAAGLGI